MTLNTVQAKIIGTARNAKTKFGLRGVVDAITADGSKVTIWKAADDLSIFRLCDGERVTLGIDGKGSVQSIEGSYDRVQAQRAANPISPVVETTIPNRPMGFTVGLPMEAERTLQRQISAIQKPVSPVAVESIPTVSEAIEQTIDAQLDKMAALFRSCLTRAETLSPSNSEALALEMFKGLTSKLAA
jgi:hypothetical protein